MHAAVRAARVKSRNRALVVSAQLFDRLKTDCADPGGARRLQIDLAVVNEQRLVGLHAQRVYAVLIDLGSGLTLRTSPEKMW